MKKFYPSSSAFMVGGAVVTKYNSGCLRSILIQSHDIRDGEIPQLYIDCGAEHERVYEADLKAKGIPYVREMTIKAPLTPNVEYSGRADFVCHSGESTVVVECKGHTSKNTRRDVIRKGEYNISYLAQLVSYMVKLRTPRGRLICGYYEEDDGGKLHKQEERTFKVEIDDSGAIHVDGCSSGYGVDDLLAHQRAAVRVLEDQEVASRPDKAHLKFGGPCSLCPFRAACDLYDASPTGTEEFLQMAQEAVDRLPPRAEPVAFKIKQPRKRKT
jgi:hypothetical protein